jgi:phospholipid transport system substrate-binding protein
MRYAKNSMRSIFMIPKFVMLLSALLLMPVADSAYGDVSDPAAIQVQILTAALLKSMQAGPAESMADRYRNLEPVIKQVFGLPLMTRFSVGPQWTTFSPDQQNALIAAFSRFTIANYAHNFRSFSGQKFEIDDVVTRGEDKIVRTHIIPVHDTPISLQYRMRQVDGVWKVIDVSAEGVSELALRRDDFGAAIAAGGAPALLAHLNKVSDDLLK